MERQEIPPSPSPPSQFVDLGRRTTSCPVGQGGTGKPVFVCEILSSISVRMSNYYFSLILTFSFHFLIKFLKLMVVCLVQQPNSQPAAHTLPFLSRTKGEKKRGGRRGFKQHGSSWVRIKTGRALTSYYCEQKL